MPVDKSGLSQKALQLITEQPSSWEYRLFGQVMADEVEKVNNLFKQGHRAKGVENAKVDSTIEFISDWLQKRIGEIQSIITELNELFNSNHDDAFGPPGKSGNPENIVTYSRKIVSFYYRAITLLQLIQNTSVNSECEEVHKELAAAVTGIIKSIGFFGITIVRQIEEAINAPATGEKRVVSLTLTLTLPDSFIEASNRLMKSETENISKLTDLVNVALERAKNDKLKSSANKSGYIYVLTNPSTNGIVKIGKTQRHPNDRAKELSSATGVPTPFVVVYHTQFDNVDEAEMFVHTKLENYRVANNREFFQIEIPTAINAVIEAKNHYKKSRYITDVSVDDEDLFGEHDFEDDNDGLEPGEEMFNLADEYYYGRGDTIQDYDEAFNLYEKAARLGYTEAFLQMGIMCRDGEGRRLDYKRAQEYFKEAIKLGNDEAWAEMAKTYNLDKHTENEAKSWKKYFSSGNFSKFSYRRNIVIFDYVVNAIEQNRSIEYKNEIRTVRDGVLGTVNRRITLAKERNLTELLNRLLKVQKILDEI